MYSTHKITFILGSDISSILVGFDIVVDENKAVEVVAWYLHRDRSTPNGMSPSGGLALGMADFTLYVIYVTCFDFTLRKALQLV
jgi:hypothetical protein